VVHHSGEGRNPAGGGAERETPRPLMLQ
jgi:hypothetical protein